MALYIKPPTGSISLNKLYNFVMKRLAFLYYIRDHSVEDVYKLIEKEALTRNSECLIEGTVKDKVSHFTLRFLCASDFQLREFFIENEVKLFNHRLLFCDFSRMHQIFQKAYEQSKQILQADNYIIKSYEKVLKSLIFVFEQLKVNKEDITAIKVPFTLGLTFIKNRQHQLHLGYIYLPLTEIKSLLMCLCQELIVEGLNQTKASLCLEELKDLRMQYLHRKIKDWLNFKLNPIEKLAPGCNLVEESKKFPLCMSNLQTLLLKHHRLKHLSRIQYTLFLKEIGVPCAEVIDLFMKEYSVPLSQPCKDGGHCSHSWTDSKKRYIYGIEHLYGKRGARKNYKAHNCLTLQNSYDCEGGCPFVTFDDQHLQSALECQNIQVKDIEDIMVRTKENKYQEACMFYLLCKVKTFKNITEKRHNFSKASAKFKSNECPIYDVESNAYLSNASLTITSPADYFSIMCSLFTNNNLI